jgi:hypothetical protein
MHAFKLPFTGLFAGGFSVLCIGLIAWTSNYQPKIILQATIQVLLIKAMVTPHAPPTAYLAVGFQGLAGSLILGHLKPYWIAAPLFVTIAITESAVQKLLTLYLFFGQPLVDAINLFFKEILAIFHLHNEHNSTKWLIYAYVFTYALGGFLMGLWLIKLPAQIEKRKTKYINISFLTLEKERPNPSSKQQRWLFTAAILSFILLTFLLAGGTTQGAPKAIYVLLRTLAALLAWWLIITPVTHWLLNKWLSKKQTSENTTITKLIDELPFWYRKSREALSIVRSQYKKWQQPEECVLLLLVAATTNTATPPD